MRSLRMTLLMPVALALMAGSALAEKITIKDALGDDNGPGNYVYPTDAVYIPGSFDIKDFELETKGDKAEISVTVAAKLDDPWRMGTGFSVQMAFVFIDTGEPGGFTQVPPGLNFEFAKDTPWNTCVILSPQPSARVQQEVNAKAGDMASHIVIPKRTRGSGSTITGTVDLASLGKGDPKTWKYECIMQSNEGFPAGNDLLTRKVNEYEGQHRFGGGTDYDCDPNVMDILGDQKQLADYACNDDGSTKKLAVLTMVKP